MDRPPADDDALTRRGLLAAAGATLGAAALGRGDGTAVPGVGTAAARHDEVLLADSFEHSSPGGPPADWTGLRRGVVVRSRSAPDGDRVLRMGDRAGQCRRMAATREVGRLPDSGVVTVSGYVHPGAGTLDCGDHRARVALHDGTPGRGRDGGPGRDASGRGRGGGSGGGRLLVGFHEDGTVVGPGGGHHGTYRIDDWNSFSVAREADRGGARFGLTVNGDWLGTVTTQARGRAAADERLLLAANASVGWDDVRVVHRRTRGVRVPTTSQVRALDAYRDALVALAPPWDPGTRHVNGPAATAVRRALLALSGPGLPDLVAPAGVSGRTDLVERTESAFLVLRESDVPEARDAVCERWRSGPVDATRRSYAALGLADEADEHPFGPLFGVLVDGAAQVGEERTPDSRRVLARHAGHVDAILRSGLSRLRSGSYPPGGDELVLVLAVLSGLARTLERTTTA